MRITIKTLASIEARIQSGYCLAENAAQGREMAIADAARLMKYVRTLRVENKFLAYRRNLLRKQLIQARAEMATVIHRYPQ